MNPNAGAWAGLTVLAFVMAGLLFVSAETLRYRQAWLSLAVFFGASVFHMLYLIKHHLVFLRRRLIGGWRRKRSARIRPSCFALPMGSSHYLSCRGWIIVSIGRSFRCPPTQIAEPGRFSEAAAAWDRTKETTSIATLEAFIWRYGETFYTQLAYDRMEELRSREIVAFSHDSCESGGTCWSQSSKGWCGVCALSGKQ
jgi:hypothetical protein